MKKLSLILIALCCTLGIHAQNNKSMKPEKGLVAYFSCTGNTKAAAQKIAKSINADLYEIKPAKAYSQADLDWTNKQSRSSAEMHDKTSRPAIAGKVGNIKKYNVIYIGYPIWWDLAPTIINTFIEKNDLKGKKVVLFATSGGSSIDNSQKVLKATYKEINWGAGKLIKSNTSDAEIAKWTKSIK